MDPNTTMATVIDLQNLSKISNTKNIDENVFHLIVGCVRGPNTILYTTLTEL